MRHVWIRGILSALWLAAAIASGRSGRTGTAALYIAACGVFLYAAYAAWKKERGDK